MQPDFPIHLFRPFILEERTREFIQGFPGQTGYAVRANFEPDVMLALANTGINWFACDTLAEIEAVENELQEPQFIFTHPVKPLFAIKEAYQKHRVRIFVIDHPAELKKIQSCVDTDALLVVRLASPSGAFIHEGHRFGCTIEQAVILAHAVVKAGFKLGLGFNIGSQVVNPLLFDEALLMLREVMYRSRFMLDMVWLGGGFPSIYDGLYPPSLDAYFTIIKEGLARLHLPRSCKVLATPGRFLVNESISILAKVEQRRGQMLYLNEGTLGGLSPINLAWWRPPVRVVRLNQKSQENFSDQASPFVLSGPAGYGNDTMNGPFYFPTNIATGDYIEFGNMGAYTAAMTTAFNSQPWPEIVRVEDAPPEAATEEQFNILHDNALRLITAEPQNKNSSNRLQKRKK